MKQSRIQYWNGRCIIRPAHPRGCERFGMDHNAIIFRHLAISQLLDGDYCKEFAAALAAGSFRGSFLFPVMELDPHDFYYSSN